MGSRTCSLIVSDVICVSGIWSQAVMYKCPALARRNNLASKHFFYHNYGCNGKKSGVNAGFVGTKLLVKPVPVCY